MDCCLSLSLRRILVDGLDRRLCGYHDVLCVVGSDFNLNSLVVCGVFCAVLALVEVEIAELEV